MDQEKKRTFNPWAIERSLTQENGSKPATIRSTNKSELMIEISNENKSKILPTKTSQGSPEFQERIKVEIVACDKINHNQGLTYIHDYNIPDIEEYGN